MPSESRISHPVYARLYDRLNRGAEKTVFPRHREYLAADLHGRVLDIGFGTGAMAPYYAASRDRGEQFDLYAVEPDPYMRHQAVETAETACVPVAVIDARAEDLPFPDDTFDIVICSLVLCSVPRVGDALLEIRRVLCDDGEFRFFEHVQSEGLRGTVEAVASPFWRPIVGGCHIDRRTGERIEALFEVSESDSFDIGTVDTFPVRRFVRGRARQSP